MKTRVRHVQLLGIAMLLACSEVCSAQQHLPFELIEQLTEPTLAREMGLFSCGQVNGEHRAAVGLAALGEGALPSIEAELDAMEQLGHEGFGSELLELAYARIKGRSAYPRLIRLENDPRFGADRELPDGPGRWSLDRSIALALGLTSFVSAPKNAMMSYHACKENITDGSFLSLEDCPSGTHAEPLINIQCLRGLEPRDALDQLIRAFERNDEFSFEVGLGPDAKSALASLLKGTTWKDYRRKLLHEFAGDLAMGYRFEEAGRWSEPDDTLEDERPAAPTIESPSLKTDFTNASGSSCGSYQVRFELDQPRQKIRHLTPYLVNNLDLDGLLHVIASCAISR
jgi:hypothetical protein